MTMNITLLPVGESLPINHALAGLVPMASEAEQASLTADIKINGLREPVVLWRGEIVDGRCRQKACLLADKAIMAKSLDDDLSEADVRIFVKSINTRRNLTMTQKIMSACKDSFRPESPSVVAIAKSWGIGRDILNNARYLYKHNPEVIEPLFNGHSIEITDTNGKTITTNKVSAVYAYSRRIMESVVNDDTFGWKEDSYISTQAGKDWYYSTVATITDMHTRMLIAELANYKFAIKPIT
jgi:hypothetical protein